MRNGLMDMNDRKVRRFALSNVKARRFGHGAEVQYKGAGFGGLKDKIGIIDAYVVGEEHLVAVTFSEMPQDDRHYLMHDVNSLDPWRGRPKGERLETEDKKVPKVEVRKGVAKGKRQKVQEEE